jgi:hypothetical protein
MGSLKMLEKGLNPIDAKNVVTLKYTQSSSIYRFCARHITRYMRPISLRSRKFQSQIPPFLLIN